MSATKTKQAPTLRFPEFTEQWQEKRGRKLFGSRRLRGKNGLPIYSVTLTNGLVPRDSLNRQFGGDADIESHLRAKPGDLVYNMMRMWQGAVGRADVECMVSPAYVVLEPAKDIDSTYFAYYLQRARSIYDLWAYSYGLTDDRLRLYYRDFGFIKFHVPQLAEQKKISTVLTTVDKKLEALKHESELLQTYKRGLMQKLFSQELRFKADDGSKFPDWEEKWLGKIFSERSKKGHESFELLSVTVKDGVIKRTKIQSKDNSSSDKSTYKSVFPGDIAYNSMRMWQGALGVSLYDGIVSPAYTVVTTRADDIPEFFAYYFKLKKVLHVFERYSQGLTSDTWNLKYPAFSKIKLLIPCVKEQERITNFLSAIDAKIDAVAEQIEKMKQFKKGLLQQMFV